MAHRTGRRTFDADPRRGVAARRAPRGERAERSTADFHELQLLADFVEKLEGLASGPVFRGHSTLGELAIVDSGSI
jgi:hypothetical protein